MFKGLGSIGLNLNTKPLNLTARPKPAAFPPRVEPGFPALPDARCRELWKMNPWREGAVETRVFATLVYCTLYVVIAHTCFVSQYPYITLYKPI